MNTLTMPPRAWYRQPWPWLLMLMPALALFGGLATWWIAAATSDPLVVDDYYREGRAINRTLARDAAALRLGLVATLSAGPDGSAVVELQARDSVELPAQLSLRLVHATRAELDRSITLAAVGRGRYVAAGQALPQAGRWHLIVEGPERQWRLTGVASGFATPQRLGAQP
jgi:hypothetical protein